MAMFDMDAMRRAHQVLRHDLERLKAEIQPSSQAGVLDLCDRLGAVRDHVANHFRLEEQNGYMDVVAKRQPRLNRAIRQLAEEHAGLLQSLDDIIAEAIRTTAVDDRLRKRITTWLESVHNHEDRENRLIEDAFELDIGTND
jgi:chromosome segregation ATPase